MRKITLLMIAALAAMFVGLNAQTATITINLESAGGNTNLGNNAYGGTGTSDRPERVWSQNGVSFGGKCITANPNNSPAGATVNTLIQAQANNGLIYNTTALPGKIVSITLNQEGTARQSSCFGGTSRLVTATAGDLDVTGTQVGSASSTGWTSSDFEAGNYTFFAIKRGGNAAYFSSIVIEYEVPSSNQVATPVVMYNGSDVTGTTVTVQGYTAAITATSTTAEAVVRYNDYGGVATWDELAASFTYEVYVPGSVTLYFKAFKTGMDASEEVSVTFVFEDPTVTRPAPPVISPNGGTFTEAQTVTLSAENGADIFYTINGNDPNAITGTFYTEPFIVSENTTVKAIASCQSCGYTMATSNIATATFTINLTPQTTEVANIAAFNALPLNTEAKITGAITVVYQNAQKNNIFTQDETGWLLVYGTSTNTYVDGDQIAGLTGKRLDYQGAPELDATGNTFPAATSGSPAVATVLTPSVLTAADANRYVAFENAEIAEDVTFSTASTVEGKIVDGEGTFIIRDQYKLFSDSFDAGDKINVKGIVRLYNGAVSNIYILAIDDVITNVDFAANNNIKIYAVNGNIVVANAKAGEHITVYNAQGQILVNQIATEGENTISVAARGILIVKAGERIAKIAQ